MPTRHAGAFVYSGAGKKQRADATPEEKLCTDEVIAIQRCLARNNHKQSRCEEAVRSWKLCCEKVRALDEGRQAASST